jgi:uroporphyrinogen-III synthase
MDMNHIGSDLQTIYKLLGNTIDTQFDRIVFLTEQGVKEAFERMASTRTTGKIVFSLRNAGESTDVSIVRSE